MGRSIWDIMEWGSRQENVKSKVTVERMGELEIEKAGKAEGNSQNTF